MPPSQFTLKLTLFGVFLFLPVQMTLKSILADKGSSSVEKCSGNDYLQFRMPVLCYHNVHPRSKNIINIIPRNFEKQMRFLKRNRYYSIIPDEIRNIKQLNKSGKPVMITFDDGKRSVYRWAFPIMKKYDFKGVVFYIAGAFRSPKSRYFLQKKEALRLLKAGWEFGSHTASHQYNHRESMKTVEGDFIRSKKIIENDFHTKVNSIAYPYGLFNNNIILITKKHYKYGFTILNGNNNCQNLFRLDRHMILRNTTMKEFNMMLTATGLDFPLKVKVNKRKLLITVVPPKWIKNLYLSYNFSRYRRYKNKGSTIRMRTGRYNDFNYIIIYAVDERGKYHYNSKLVYVKRNRVIMF